MRYITAFVVFAVLWLAPIYGAYLVSIWFDWHPAILTIVMAFACMDPAKKHAEMIVKRWFK